ncbi:MAG: hypothetical protein K8R23_01430 [Chthoniobacter sp.]|nr:hypothetical protein [Chthoniobacter sp.]
MSDDCKEILAFLQEHWPKINKDRATLSKYFENKREVARTEAARDLQKEIRHLLTDIHDESLDDQSRSREMTVSRTMARFGSLLCVLSEQADIQTRRIVRLTWALVALTIPLLGLTAYLSYDAYLKSKSETAQHEASNKDKEPDAKPK